MKQVVIITGASSGIGYDLAKKLVSKDYIVYGISRSSFELNGVKHLKGDVTNEEQINELINGVIEKEGKIDILINNAGMGISGSIEASKLEDVKKIFDVNFNGAFITIKAVLPHMRKQSFGKIINIGSVASEFAIPFQAFYSATKAALKTFGEALDNEVSPYGINVCTILPGDIKTNFTKNRNKNIGELKVYENRVSKSIGVMEKDEQKGMPVSYSSKVIYRVIKKKKMPLTKTIGNEYKVLIFLKRLLPLKLINKIVGNIYAFKKEK